MNSRERTFQALKHRAADRIPIDFWATGAVVERLENELGISYAEFLDRYGVDLRYIEGPAYIGPPLESGADIWGVRRIAVTAGACGTSESYSEVLDPPLAGAETVEEIEAYPHWPDPDWFDYDVVETQCDAILKNDRVAVFMGDRLNRVAQLKPAMYLRGSEEIFLDMALRRDIAEAVFGRIRRFYIAYLERILDAAKGKIDIVLTGDDFGAQHGLLVGAPMWRDMLEPGFREYIRLIKSRGAAVMHHSCGSVVDIIPEMIDCGLDILQSIQPEAGGMALADLQRTYGDKLCFHGGISIQKLMPYGMPKDIRKAVQAIAEQVRDTGGYIFCTSHNIQADTSTENILALVEAYLEYGLQTPASSPRG